MCSAWGDFVLSVALRSVGGWGSSSIFSWSRCGLGWSQWGLGSTPSLLPPFSQCRRPPWPTIILTSHGFPSSPGPLLGTQQQKLKEAPLMPRAVMGKTEEASFPGFSSPDRKGEQGLGWESCTLLQRCVHAYKREPKSAGHRRPAAALALLAGRHVR